MCRVLTMLLTSYLANGSQARRIASRNAETQQPGPSQRKISLKVSYINPLILTWAVAASPLENKTSVCDMMHYALYD